MSARLRILVLAALALPAGTLPGATPVKFATPAVPLSRQIDALLKQRLRPEPLPLDLPNPFALPGNNNRRDAGAPGGEQLAAVPAAGFNGDVRQPTNAEVLAECAAHLRIGGLMRVKGQAQLVINDVARKEGDLVSVPWNGTKIQLTVVLILPEQVVLRYNDVELTLRF